MSKKVKPAEQISKQNTGQLKRNFIACSDGMTNIFKIAELLSSPLDKLCNEYSVLKSKKVLK